MPKSPTYNLKKNIIFLKPKCVQYWPDIGQEKDFGPLKITMESVKEYAFFVERTLHLTNKKVCENYLIEKLSLTITFDVVRLQKL